MKKACSLITKTAPPLVFLLITAVLLTACTPKPEGTVLKQSEAAAIKLAVKTAPAIEPEASERAEEDEREAFVRSLLEDMTTEEKIGQMLMISFAETSQAVSAIENLGVGGVIYFASNIDTEEQTKALSDTLQKSSKIPLFIAVDEEGGRVSRITKSGKINMPSIPSARALAKDGNAEKAYEAAAVISETLTRLGINVNFAPCADLSAESSPATDVIGDRAFSHDPLIAAKFVEQAVGAYNDSSILSAAKHFPGHGSATGDTHLGKIVSQKSLAELEQADIIPFSAAIYADAPMIMLSHITVNEWGVPASLSPGATSFLRDIGFTGIIITDSFQMKAISEHYSASEAAVQAVKAGIDVILMPQNADEAFQAISQAASAGEISGGLIDSAARRILLAKYDYELFSQNF